MRSGISYILEERLRQLTTEGFDAEHDDANVEGELAIAAACYAVESLKDEDRTVRVHRRHPRDFNAWADANAKVLT